MKFNSILQLKHVIWGSAGLVVVILFLLFVTHLGAKPTTHAPQPPVVEVAPVEQRNVPIYGEWIGTLTGQVNADVKAQVTGYLLTRNYKEGSFVRKGQILFEIDPRPFQAALDQAKGQLAQAQGAAGSGRGAACDSEGEPAQEPARCREVRVLWQRSMPSASRISTMLRRRTLQTRPR